MEKFRFAWKDSDSHGKAQIRMEKLRFAWKKRRIAGKREGGEGNTGSWAHEPYASVPSGPASVTVPSITDSMIVNNNATLGGGVAFLDLKTTMKLITFKTFNRILFFIIRFNQWE